MLPALTVIDDFVGMFGGWLIGKIIYDLDFLQYWSQTWRALVWSDVAQGLLKPFVYSFVISLIGCFYGLRASGGTQGVGRATTQAMVAASVTILILNLFMGLIFVKYSGQ
jgi:phospholipid/cholesterol/gamma-HCH transport system permease protein